MRAFMWGKGRDWLRTRGRIPVDPRLESDLTAPSYTHNARDQVVLESKESIKKRGLGSPDDGDALMLTFAAPVKIRQEADRVEPNEFPGARGQGSSSGAWMG
jgi:hypothetical protein